jgi:hypothetical protein
MGFVVFFNQVAFVMKLCKLEVGIRINEIVIMCFHQVGFDYESESWWFRTLVGKLEINKFVLNYSIQANRGSYFFLFFKLHAKK